MSGATGWEAFPRWLQDCHIESRLESQVSYLNYSWHAQGLTSIPLDLIRRCVPPPFKVSTRRTFSATPSVFGRKKSKKHHFGDAYAIQHAKQRRAANESLQSALKQQRAEAMGDPIRGITTPFVESFDTGLPPATVVNPSQDESRTDASINSESTLVQPPAERLSHFISNTDLQKSLDFSRVLIQPVLLDQDIKDPQQEAVELKSYQIRHRNASEALKRILSVENASSKHRTRINTQRIIDTFGRHVTDQYMKPKAPSPLPPSARGPRPTVTPRAGPDVGSSEVQIGILTAKIRVLADRYANENRNDKVNKRNLRLLLHRRQKLLKYMHKKERGSARWHHMVEQLGLSEATWRGEIELR